MSAQSQTHNNDVMNNRLHRRQDTWLLWTIWLTKAQMVSSHCHLGLPCNPSCHEFQGYQGCQPGPLQWKRDIYMTKWFKFCHAPIDQKVVLPLTQECQGNLVLPTMAKVAHRWKMKENKGKQLAKRLLLSVLRNSCGHDTVIERSWKRCQITRNNTK